MKFAILKDRKGFEKTIPIKDTERFIFIECPPKQMPRARVSNFDDIPIEQCEWEKITFEYKGQFSKDYFVYEEVRE